VRLQYWLASNMDRGAARPMGGLRGRLFQANGRFGVWRNAACRPETRRRLLDAYRDDIARTAALVSRQLDPWVEGHG
jgi:hypothetical protein